MCLSTGRGQANSFPDFRTYSSHATTAGPNRGMGVALMVLVGLCQLDWIATGQYLISPLTQANPRMGPPLIPTMLCRPSTNVGSVAPSGRIP